MWWYIEFGKSYGLGKDGGGGYGLTGWENECWEEGLCEVDGFREDGDKNSTTNFVSTRQKLLSQSALFRHFSPHNHLPHTPPSHNSSQSSHCIISWIDTYRIYRQDHFHNINGYVLDQRTDLNGKNVVGVAQSYGFEYVRQ